MTRPVRRLMAYGMLDSTKPASLANPTDLRAMQAVAAELSGYAGKSRCFWSEQFENNLFQFIQFKTRLSSPWRGAACSAGGI